MRAEEVSSFYKSLFHEECVERLMIEDRDWCPLLGD